MRRWMLVIPLVAVGAALLYLAQTTREAPIGPGIPLEMANDRATRVRDLSYAATFHIPASRTEPIRGELTATFHLSDANADLAFDFSQPADRLLATRVNGEPAPSITVEDGHVVVPSRLLTSGAANEVTFEFLAGDAALNRQDEFMYTLFVPARASSAMPVFDQPNLKGRWVVSLNIPEGWSAVANGAETGRINTGGPSGANGRTEIIFARTEPLPTYLVAFAAGKFSIETAERNGREFRMFHRETDAAKVMRNRDAIFDLHASALSWLEEYTAIPYAFGKFDFALIPSFQFGGMEHAGAVFYNASALLLDESATQNQRLGRASLIAHETAHMWFGDLVTMRWFNDVWMKEVFANFMAAKIVNPSFPEVNHDLRFLFSHYPAAYEVDRTAGANPIRQDLANLSEAGSLYGAIIYQKAPIVMRQLERLMGPGEFRDGLREYLRAHAMSNATWPDLIAVLDRRTPADLVAWSRAWVEERGRPRIDVQITRRPEGPVDVRLSTVDPLTRGLVWPQDVTLVFGSGDRAAAVDATLGANGEAAVSSVGGALPEGPRWVLPTGNGLGYGDFVLPTDMLDRMAEDLPLAPDPLTRGAMLVTLWESMLENRLAPARLLKALTRTVPGEADELNLARQLGYAQSIYWRFSTPTTRASVGPQLESLFRAGLDRARSTSQKSVWFNALKSVAMSRDTLAWLESVWSRHTKIDGLPLSETDEIDLALDLALRGVDVLDAQEQRITNPDRRARFAFVRPAFAADATVRRALFERFRQVDQRRREAWVLEAMNAIHHPLRSADAAPLVVPALELVREIRDTGDIFFPKRWTDATLGGHQSPETAAAVRAFIDGLPPDYPQRLRWVLEASADPLFRAATIVGR